MLPPLVVTLAAAGALAFLLLAPTSVGMLTRVLVLSGAGLIALIAILLAATRASATHREADGDLAEIRSLIPRGPEELRAAADRWRRGDRPQIVDPPTRSAGELRLLAYEVERFRADAIDAVMRSSSASSSSAVSVNAAHAAQAASGTDVRVGVFVNLARRLQSLVHREIQLLDDLEAQVEDPDFLKGLFAVDHLATRIRRHAENLAVLGGAVSNRQWSRPVNMYVVLRSAVAEVEQYARVKLVRPIDGTLKGHAVADVIHLVAELVENATSFSNPSTQVLLRAQRVTAGVALEVEDRGLGMPQEDQSRLNGMLSSPDQVDVAELLNDGRIGLFVVSTLARRHGIAVQLQTNIFGGTQAVVVLPNALLGEAEARRTEVSRSEPNRQLEQRPSSTTSEPMPMRVPSAAPASGPPSNPPISAPPVSPAPMSAPPLGTAPISGSPVSGSPRPRRSDEGTRRPLPYAGRHYGSGGVASTSRDPRTEHGFTASGHGAHDPLAPAPTSGVPQYSSTRSSTRDSSVPRLFDSSNSNETTGVINMGHGSSDDESVHDSGSASQPEAADGSDHRPQLPQRRRQTHLAPQLREPVEPLPRHEQLTEHDPSLMMAFQTGVNRAGNPDEGAEGRFEGAS